MMATQDRTQQLIQKAAEVKDKYLDWLMRMPHVIGVGIGFAKKGGERTADVALIVMVDRKLPESDLNPQTVIPHQLDGVRVDVQEMGVFAAH
jgi:hypothetical protein